MILQTDESALLIGVDQRLILGLGISIAFGFARWLWPSVPKPFAIGGFAVGVSFLLWSLMPSIRLGPGILGIAGLVAITFAIRWQHFSSPSDAIGSVQPVSTNALSIEPPAVETSEPIVGRVANRGASAKTQAEASLEMIVHRNILSAPNKSDEKVDDNARRSAKLSQLTKLYVLTHDGISSRLFAGLDLPPIEFLNEELEREGANWRVRSVHGIEAETYNLN